MDLCDCVVLSLNFCRSTLRILLRLSQCTMRYSTAPLQSRSGAAVVLTQHLGKSASACLTMRIC